MKILDLFCGTKSIAKAFAESGYNIALHYNKSEEKALLLKAELEKEFGVRVIPIKADLCINDEIEALAKKALSELKKSGISFETLSELLKEVYEQ